MTGGRSAIWVVNVPGAEPETIHPRPLFNGLPAWTIDSRMGSTRLSEKVLSARASHALPPAEASIERAVRALLAAGTAKPVRSICGMIHSETLMLESFAAKDDGRCA